MIKCKRHKTKKKPKRSYLLFIQGYAKYYSLNEKFIKSVRVGWGGGGGEHSCWDCVHLRTQH